MLRHAGHRRSGKQLRHRPGGNLRPDSVFAHHKKVSHVAFVTDSPIGEIAEHVGNHFVNAEIKSFTFNELEESIRWISDGNNV